jgi:hypothetical protein
VDVRVGAGGGCWLGCRIHYLRCATAALDVCLALIGHLRGTGLHMGAMWVAEWNGIWVRGDSTSAQEGHAVAASGSLPRSKEGNAGEGWRSSQACDDVQAAAGTAGRVYLSTPACRAGLPAALFYPQAAFTWFRWVSAVARWW